MPSGTSLPGQDALKTTGAAPGGTVSLGGGRDPSFLPRFRPPEPAPPGGVGRALTTAELRHGKPDRRAFLARPRLPVRVVLDGVRQGHNVGALFRLCDAFPCERLVACGRDAGRGTRKLVQAAQGAHKWLPWEQQDSAKDAVRAARAEGWQVVVVEQASGAVYSRTP